MPFRTADQINNICSLRTQQRIMRYTSYMYMYVNITQTRENVILGTLVCDYLQKMHENTAMAYN